MRKILSGKQFEFYPIVFVSLLSWILFIRCNKSNQPPGNSTTTAPVVTSKIIYTNVSLDSIVLGYTIGEYALDLNNDGVKDFVFDISNDTFTCDVQTGVATNFIVNPIGSNQIEGYDSLPDALDTVSATTDSAQARIGPLALWSASSNQMIVELIAYTSPPAPPVVVPPDSPANPGSPRPPQHRTFPFNHTATSGITEEGNCSSTTAGNWANVNPYYLGLKLISGGHTYYGWARLSFSSYSGTLTLFDYAYNSVPDQPILAGQQK